MTAEKSMLRFRPFKNSDTQNLLRIWETRRSADPDFFSPLTTDLLESQILGNLLFDPNGVIFAENQDETVGFIHATFAPNADATGPASQTGIIYPPILPPQHPDAFAMASGLIAAAESYLKQRHVVQWYAGGYANGSPFYTGLYGRCNPEGVFERDEIVLAALLESGYRRFETSIRMTLPAAEFFPVITPKLHETRRQFLVRRIPGWSPPNWWEANIYRNFFSTEWNAFARNDTSPWPEPVGGCLLQRMIPGIFGKSGEDEGGLSMILSYIGVQESHLRHGIGSMLLGTVIREITSESFRPINIYTIVSEEDQRMVAFLGQHGFRRAGNVHSFYKMIS